MKIIFKKLHKDAIIPGYQSELASGFDLHSLYNYEILPGAIKIIKTGLAVEIPVGFELQIRPRSGLSVGRPNYINNSPGTIDADYRGEIKIIICNNNTIFSWRIKKGDRIAQAILSRTYQAEIVVKEELSDTERGENGFGSSGIE